MCMAVLSMCMYMYHRHAWCPWRNLGLELEMGGSHCVTKHSGHFPKSKYFTQLLISPPPLCSRILLHLTYCLGSQMLLLWTCLLALDYRSHNAFLLFGSSDLSQGLGTPGQL